MYHRKQLSLQSSEIQLEQKEHFFSEVIKIFRRASKGTGHFCYVKATYSVLQAALLPLNSARQVYEEVRHTLGLIVLAAVQEVRRVLPGSLSQKWNQTGLMMFMLQLCRATGKQNLAPLCHRSHLLSATGKDWTPFTLPLQAATPRVARRKRGITF